MRAVRPDDQILLGVYLSPFVRTRTSFSRLQAIDLRNEFGADAPCD